MMNVIAALSLPVILATTPSDSAKPAAPVDSADLTLVVVENDRSVPVTVYVQDHAREYRLGIVAANRTTTLALRAVPFAKSEIQFFVMLARGIETATAPLDVTRGERIGLVVESR